GCNCGIVHNRVKAEMGFVEQTYEVVEYEKEIGDKKLNNEIKEKKVVDNA
ncbi:36944_t:CDS:1, partial [Gigaspora margarita]